MTLSGRDVVEIELTEGGASGLCPSADTVDRNVLGTGLHFKLFLSYWFYQPENQNYHPLSGIKEMSLLKRELFLIVSKIKPLEI